MFYVQRNGTDEYDGLAGENSSIKHIMFIVCKSSR